MKLNSLEIFNDYVPLQLGAPIKIIDDSDESSAPEVYNGSSDEYWSEQDYNDDYEMGFYRHMQV